MPNPPLSEAARLRIAELHAEGLSVRQIARELGIQSSTVSRHGRRMGLVFDRAATTAATETRRADARTRRSVAAARAIEMALAELDRLGQPARIVGVSMGAVVERVIARPPAGDRLAIARTFGALIDAHLKLADLEDDGTAHARSLLGQLQADFDQARESLHPDDGTGADD